MYESNERNSSTPAMLSRCCIPFMGTARTFHTFHTYRAFARVRTRSIAGHHNTRGDTMRRTGLGVGRQ